jgi:hypothetical protein
MPIDYIHFLVLNYFLLLILKVFNYLLYGRRINGSLKESFILNRKNIIIFTIKKNVLVTVSSVGVNEIIFKLEALFEQF